MKLKPDFIPMNIDETPYLVPSGESSFQGVIRGNTTAGVILNCLRGETTEEEIVSALCSRFNVPKETAASDVAEIIAKLREIGALRD